MNFVCFFLLSQKFIMPKPKYKQFPFTWYQFDRNKCVWKFQLKSHATTKKFIEIYQNIFIKNANKIFNVYFHHSFRQYSMAWSAHEFMKRDITSSLLPLICYMLYKRLNYNFVIYDAYEITTITNLITTCSQTRNGCCHTLRTQMKKKMEGKVENC